jgi:glycerophosphoryl diester phosphodiesterase
MSIRFKPPVIAHRGMSGAAPENTMAAFTKTVQAGIQWVEFDVVLASCGTPVIFHDETLERTTNGKGSIGDFPFSFLETLDAGSWFKREYSGERIPALVEVVRFLYESGLHANIEIKPLPGQEEETVTTALGVIAQYFLENSPHILFSSFSLPALQYLRTCAPRAMLGLLLHEWRDDWQNIADALNCISVHVNQEILTKPRADAIRQAGKILLSYTVNTPERARELFAMGVNAVFSDFPDRIAKMGQHI